MQKEEELKVFFNSMQIKGAKEFDAKLIQMNKTGREGVTFDHDGKPMVFHVPSECEGPTCKNGLQYKVGTVMSP